MFSLMVAASLSGLIGPGPACPCGPRCDCGPACVCCSARVAYTAAPQAAKPPAASADLEARVAMLEQDVGAVKTKVARIDDGIARIEALLMKQAAPPPPGVANAPAPAPADPAGRPHYPPPTPGGASIWYNGHWYAETADPRVLVANDTIPPPVANVRNVRAPAAVGVAAPAPFAQASGWAADPYSTLPTPAHGAGLLSSPYPGFSGTGITYTLAPGAASPGSISGGCANGACAAPQRSGFFGRLRGR